MKAHIRKILGVIEYDSQRGIKQKIHTTFKCRTFYLSADNYRLDKYITICESNLRGISEYHKIGSIHRVKYTHIRF
jgi:hypothetical protein